MRKTLIVATTVAGVLLIAVLAVVIYAVLNLNAIVSKNQAYLLTRVGSVLGRPVQVQQIRVGLGWSLSLEMTGLQVADDPAFSQLPFVTAKQVSGRVLLLPLLSRQVQIDRLMVLNPDIRILRNRSGALNISSLGKSGSGSRTGTAGTAHVTDEGSGGGPITMAIESLQVKEGSGFYQDASTSSPAARIGHVNFDLNGFSLDAPFDMALTAAVLGGQQNLVVHGHVGPVMRAGSIDLNQAAVKLSVNLGPVMLDRLRTLPELRRKIPNKLSMPDPIAAQLSVNGTLRNGNFTFSSDLSSSRVVYLGLFDKPAGTVLAVSAEGYRRDQTLGISRAKVRVADLKATVSDVKLADDKWSAKIDTNRFDIGSLARLPAALDRFAVNGRAEAHLTAVSSAAVPRMQGAIGFSAVAVKLEGGKLPGISNLAGVLHLAGNSAQLDPTSFKIGSGSAVLKAELRSLTPVNASYSLSATNLKLAEFLPNRPSDDQVETVDAKGNLVIADSAFSANSAILSPAGKVAGVPYRNLAFNASYDGRQVRLDSLKMTAYDGSISGNAQALAFETHRFATALQLANVNLQQALEAQQSKAAGVVRGSLSGRMRVAGRGASFDQIKPALSGDGAMAVVGGKLVGVNVVADAIRKINGIPGIDTLLTPAIAERHPELFRSPDTDLRAARLSFVLSGPRFTTHDLTVEAADYRLIGDGWFDMDRKVDLAVHLLISRQLSSELQAGKKNIVYLMNNNGEIEIPLSVRGELPKPQVQPDIQFVAQRAAQKAMEKQGNKLITRFLDKKGLGKFLGTPDSGNGAPPANPLGPLEKFFH